MFICQNMIEQSKEQYLRDDLPFNSSKPLNASTLCAWCLSEQGIPADEGSHGICMMHANKILLQHKMRRKRHNLLGA